MVYRALTKQVLTRVAVPLKYSQCFRDEFLMKFSSVIVTKLYLFYSYLLEIATKSRVKVIAL